MKLIEFDEVNIRIAEHQDEYETMPAHHDVNRGIVICCWKLTFKERIKVLFTGKIWHSIMTFNKSLQPQLLQLDKPFEKVIEND